MTEFASSGSNEPAYQPLEMDSVSGGSLTHTVGSTVFDEYLVRLVAKATTSSTRVGLRFESRSNNQYNTRHQDGSTTTDASEGIVADGLGNGDSVQGWLRLDGRWKQPKTHWGASMALRATENASKTGVAAYYPNSGGELAATETFELVEASGAMNANWEVWGLKT